MGPRGYKVQNRVPGFHTCTGPITTKLMVTVHPMSTGSNISLVVIGLNLLILETKSCFSGGGYKVEEGGYKVGEDAPKNSKKKKKKLSQKNFFFQKKKKKIFLLKNHFK